MSERRPGKFEGCPDQDLGERLYQITLDGGCDDELGDVDGFGWFGLIRMDMRDGTDDPRFYIVAEDSQGFFDYDEFASPLAAKRAWAAVETAYEKFCEEEGD